MKRNKNFEDLSGRRFGDLIVIGMDEDRSEKANNKYWICFCSCGVVKSIFGGHLKNGSIVTCGNRSVHRIGEKNSNWRGGKTTEIQSARTSKKYNEWRNQIYALDNYTCQCCLRNKGIKKEAHHIKNFSDNKDIRYNVNNGITMCYECHSMYQPGSFHHVYGTRDNTPQQLEEYINNKRKQLGILIPFSINEYLQNKRSRCVSNWLFFINSDAEDVEWSEMLNYEKEDA